MYLETSDLQELVRAVEGLSPGAGETVVVLTGEKEPPDIDRLIDALTARDVSFLGGIFPSVTFGDKKHESGVVLAKLPVLTPPLLVENLGAANGDLDRLAKSAEGATRRPTALVLADGLSPEIAAFLQAVYDRMGDSVNYLGGGAGSLSLEPQRCVFTDAGFVQNGAAIALLDLDSSLGVRHGWERLAGPIVATATAHNEVRELNWKRAFDVYAETVEEDSQREIRGDNFFEISKGYPFGMFKEGHEDIIRDPIRVDESGAVICVGEVPPNSVLHIMKGEPQSLIAAAAQAAEDSLARPPERIHTAFIVDCISRAIFLEAAFETELGAAVEKIQRVEPEQTPMGMLTLGEISSYGDGYLEFFNKTIVVGLLGD